MNVGKETYILVHTVFFIQVIRTQFYSSIRHPKFLVQQIAISKTPNQLF